MQGAGSNGTSKDMAPKASNCDSAQIKRQPRLDALRGVAILLVLGRHYLILPTWRLIGWCGVDLFFVLSGFLVSSLIFREYQAQGHINLKKFWLRRTVRIVPPFLAMLLGTVILRTWVGPPFDVSSLLPELTWTQNYLPGLWVHTWSLAVEEHFYILLPLLLGFLLVLSRGGDPERARDPFKPLPWITLAVGLLVLATRILTVSLFPYDTRTHLYPTHLRIDSLLFGVLLAYYYCFHRSRVLDTVGRFKFQIGAMAAVLAIPVFILPIEHPFMHTVGFTLTYLSAGGAILLALRDSTPRAWFVPALAYVGRRSYSIYLWHLTFINCGMAMFLKMPILSNLPESVVYLAGSVALGSALYALIEVPTNSLRDWIQNRRTPKPSFLRTESQDLLVEGIGPEPTLSYGATPGTHFYSGTKPYDESVIGRA
jgi:peptidoglycan/LPS O-acetylase OafA/YrhL